jgi:ABC-type amino acid transport substrate-binding protein
LENVVTPPERYLKARGIRYRSCGHSDAECLGALSRGEVDAIVGEAPVISYQAAKNYANRVIVLPGTFDNHGYAFAFQLDSPLRRQFDLATLEIVESQEWKDILSKYDSDR